MSTELQHTPGPWEWRTNQNGSVNIFGEDGCRAILCDAFLINQEGNARLIAAAPDLLEVSERILAPDMIDYLPAEYVAKVRAAIAKAIGKEAQS